MIDLEDFEQLRRGLPAVPTRALRVPPPVDRTPTRLALERVGEQLERAIRRVDDLSRNLIPKEGRNGDW